MREKLIELSEQLRYCAIISDCNNCKVCELQCVDFLLLEAAELLESAANGVTIQKWIPVTERLPETIPCGAGTAYSEAVNVLTDGRKVLTAIWNGTHWICDAEFWDAEFEEITHWTPVLLPLPEPPKEDKNQ